MFSSGVSWASSAVPNTMTMKQRVFLHACCESISDVVLLKLKELGLRVSGLGGLGFRAKGLGLKVPGFKG